MHTWVHSMFVQRERDFESFRRRNLEQWVSEAKSLIQPSLLTSRARLSIGIGSLQPTRKSRPDALQAWYYPQSRQDVGASIMG
jgi:hypothetical protein